jgi:two-component system sensor histidine kinase AlgZ
VGQKTRQLYQFGRSRRLDVTGAQETQAPERPFLPDFCGLRPVFAVLVVAELLAILLVLVKGGTWQTLWRDVSLMSLLVQWIALTCAGVLCGFRKGLRRLTPSQTAIASYILILLVTLAVSSAAWALLQQIPLGPGSGPRGYIDFVLRSLGVSAIAGALLVRYGYLQFLWRRQLLAEVDARLQSLQSRIRPHFLFNSMNTIASLIRSRPTVAEEVVEDLADLFRMALSDVKHRSTLGEEIELARRYLNIERQRLGNRLQVRWDLQDLPETAALPALVLQPLLENAVYHGVEPAEDHGEILIAGRYQRGKVNISIRNSVPVGRAEAHRAGNRIALDNIRQRLEAFFDSRADLQVAAVDGYYQVRLVFPHPWRPL